MTDTSVSIIGCGPIGLAGSLLLSRHGVQSVILERRGELNNHPRSRFVDTNTMELFREFGIEKAVEATGLGPDWTAFNRWSDTLVDEPYALIPSPTFLSLPRSTSPCIPVMTAQDEVEAALMSAVRHDPNITVRFCTEVTDLHQSDDGTTATWRNTKTGENGQLTADYTIGADGPGSSTRHVVGTHLEAEPRPVYSQDVIFDADLSPFVGDRKGALLYTTNSAGVLIFQPLDGKRRWRCQVIVADENLVSEEVVGQRLQAALGTDEPVAIDITSMRMWQPTPGCVTSFRNGRIFLAGDAAHVSVPTGGMGNNIGFAGVRNLAWKLAYVIRGLAPTSILDTYEIEHRPIALERIDYGVATTDHMGRMMLGHMAGHDVAEHVAATHQYADYDHVLLGFELSSGLIAPNDEPRLDSTDSAGFVPRVRNGGRAPHVWIDDEEMRSVLDWFGRSYVLVLGSECSAADFEDAARSVGRIPFDVRQLPQGRALAPYKTDGVVLVRPDGIVADHWRPETSIGDPADRISVSGGEGTMGGEVGARMRIGGPR